MDGNIWGRAKATMYLLWSYWGSFSAVLDADSCRHGLSSLAMTLLEQLDHKTSPFDVPLDGDMMYLQFGHH